jgi:hypothetical protein
MRFGFGHHDRMELMTFEGGEAVVRLSRTEVLALVNICNNSARGLFEAPERHMATRLREELRRILDGFADAPSAGG